MLLRGLGAVGDLAGPRAVLVEDGRIEAIDVEAERAAPDDARIIEAGGLVAVPGFIELQINGADGHDFTTDPGAMWRVGGSLSRYGVTAFLPTIVTSPRGTVDAALAAWRGGGSGDGAQPLGLHVEGPYLSPARCGAHDRSLLRDPDSDEIDRWLAGEGLRIVTLAPEIPGGLDAVALLATAGVVVSVGHTDADAETTTRAIEAGARYATHLFNAMPPLGHRDPGPVGALLADPRTTLGVIVDGHHLDPLVVGVVARAAVGRLSLVSDAIAALGLADGRHRLGERSVEVAGGTARLADGTLAGSVVGLDAGVRAVAEITGSPRQAVEAVTAVPARLLGLDDGRGVLQPGGRADIVLLDTALEVRGTLIGGELAFVSEVVSWA
jgi:N-acetylglucosamine-6-phosphate deacetylase